MQPIQHLGSTGCVGTSFQPRSVNPCSPPMPARASGGPSHSLQALAVRPRADELQPSSPRGQYGPGGLRHGHFQSSLRDILTWCRVFSLPSSTGVPHAKGSCVSSLMNKSLSVHPPHLVGRLGGHGGRVVRPGGRQCGGSVSRRFMPGAPVCDAGFATLAAKTWDTPW